MSRPQQVGWLACGSTEPWPVPIKPIVEFAMVSEALKDETGPYGYRVWDRLECMALLGGPGKAATQEGV